jgi:hypothetical protein
VVRLRVKGLRIREVAEQIAVAGADPALAYCFFGDSGRDVATCDHVLRPRQAAVDFPKWATA